MKKLILIVSIILSILGMAIVALPTFLRITGLAQPLKKYLLSSLLEEGKYTFNLDDFKIGLGRIEFYKLSFKTKNDRYDVSIDNLRFYYDLGQLIIHPKTPLRALQSVTLVQPKVVLRRDSVKSTADQNSKWQEIERFLDQLKEKVAIKSLRIEQAKIVVLQNDGSELPLATRLSGELFGRTRDRFEVSLEGALLARHEQNVHITAKIDLNRPYFKLLAKIDRYRLDNSGINRLFAAPELQTGSLSGWLLAENRGVSLKNVRLFGEFEFENCDLSLKKIQLDSLKFKAILTDNQLLVENLQGRFNGAQLTGNFQLADVFEPILEGNFQIDRLLLKDVPGMNSEAQWINQSRASVALRLRYDFSKQKSDLWLEDGQLKKEDAIWANRLQAHIRISKDTVRVPNFKLRFLKKNRIWGHALLLKKPAIFSIALNMERKNDQHVIFDRLSQKINHFDVQLSYLIDKQLLKGQWHYRLNGGQDSLFVFNGSIQGNADSVRVDVLSENEAGLQASLRMAGLKHGFQIKKGIIKNFPFDKLSSAPILSDFLARVYNKLEIRSLDKNTIETHLLLTDKKNIKNQLDILAFVRNITSPTPSFTGLCRIKNITGKINVDFSADHLVGHFNFKDQIMGNLNLDLKKQEYLNGRIDLNNFQIVQAFSDSLAPDNFRFLGSINGFIEVTGDLNHPQLTADLKGDRFVFNDIGYYQAAVKLLANKDSLRVDSLLIAINNLPIVQGKAKINLKQDTVSGAFTGNEVDVEQLLATFWEKHVFLSGIANYSMNVSGSLKQPVFDMDLTIQNGYLDRIPFDNFSIRLKNKYRDGGSLFDLENQIFQFERLVFSKKDRYELNGLGEIPFDPTRKLDVYANFKGDLFCLIPYYQPFFEKGVSDVELHLALGGTLEQIRLSSGYLLINNGELWLKNVAHHITDITGVVEKRGDSNQVNFINVTGKSGGETLTINSVRNIVLANGRALQPWYFKELDLDFGVLKLTTTGKGVRLHIPGLMQKGDEGRMFLTGINDGEAFYFAGPVKHPVARGKVVLYDTRMTFPFIEDSHPGSKPSVVVNFLENINWDVQVVSGEDVVYYREIPAYIDNVNTELYIDESSPGLHFKGILNQGTFHVTGRLSSSRGRLEYLDQTFRVDYFQAEFTESSPYPIISGQAWTTIRDSIGAVPKTVYLKLYALDQETKEEKQQGSWENFKFKLVSADPQIGESQEQVLAYLGFSVGNLRDKMTSVGGAVAEKYVFRPLFRPIERALERNLGIDMVRINSNIARNLFYSSIGFGQHGVNRNQLLINPFNTQTPYLFLMQSSEVTIGKYLTQNLFLTYTGQLVSFYDQTKPSFDINHSIGLEYRFLRNILLEIEYDRELMGYYKIQNQKQYLEDFRIRLRHSFTF